MELFVETCIRSDDRQKGVQLFVDSQARHSMVCWFSTIFLLSYYFLEFDGFIFSFQDTYNSWLNERYGKDPLNHLDLDLDLWLEVESPGGLDRNRVYRLSNTTIEKLCMTHSVSTIMCLQLIWST